MRHDGGDGGGQAHPDETRLRQMLESSADVLLDFDPDRTLRWASPSLESLLGWRPAQVLNTRFHITTELDEATADRAWREGAELSRSSARFRAQTPRADGSTTWTDTVLSFRYDSTGALTGATATIRDASEQVAEQRAGRAAEVRFRNAMEHSAIGMALVAPNGAFIAVNGALCTMLGRSERELRAVSWQILTHSADLAADEDLVTQVLAGERDTYRLRKRYLRPDGQVVWGDLSVSCVRTDTGEVDYFISQIVDVTEEITTRAALERSEARYRLLAENSSDVVAWSSPDGELEWVSESVTGLLGWKPTDLIGRTLMSLVHPADEDAVRSLDQPLAEGGAATSQLRLQRSSGGFRWVQVAAKPILEADRRVVGHIAEWRDFEAEHASREALETSQAQFQLLAENAANIVTRTTKDTVLEWVSPSVFNILGWRPEDLVGHRVHEFIHPDDARQETARDDAVAQKRAATFAARARTAAGEYRWFEILLRPVLDAQGEVVGEVAGWRDIQAERDAREALEASRERYRLLAENSANVVMRTRAGVVLWVSPSLQRMLGWEPEEWVGQPIEQFLHPDERTQLAAYRSASPDHENRVARFRMRNRDGQYQWIEATLGTYRGQDGTVDGGVSSFRTIDDVVQREGELQRRATLDDLTGALKRDEALRRLEQMGGYLRSPGSESAVIFCDLDDFKEINDNHGHAVGDEVLRTLAQRFRSTLRSSDVLARMGGDEFLMLLDGAHNLEEATEIAEKLRRVAMQPIPVLSEVGSVTLTVSIGVTLRVADETPDALIARADRAMYSAKRSGRNRVVSVD